MVRRATPARIEAERFFPVRVRIAVPAGGFGVQLDQMYGWLNLHAGRDNYAIHGGANDLGVDAALFYFLDIETARAFVQRFACGLALISARRPGE